METKVTREQAINLLKKYNQEPFHLLHGLTVEGVMGWYAGELGYGEEAHFWSVARGALQKGPRVAGGG